VLRDGVQDQTRQAGVAELGGRQVDPDAQVGQPRLPPAPRLGAGLAQHPGADLDGDASRLDEVDELGRRQQAARGVLPAQQRLDADDASGRHADLRLVAQAELGLGRGAPQLVAQRPARARHLADRGVEEERTTAALGHRPPERQVGVGHQGVRVPAVGGAQGDAGAGTDRDDSTFLDPERPRQGLDRPRRRRHHRGRLRHSRQQEREHVAADAGRRAAVAGAGRP
jgi:hypothetical protein